MVNSTLKGVPVVCGQKPTWRTGRGVQRSDCLLFTPEKADDQQETRERGIANDQYQRLRRGKRQASLLSLQADLRP